MFLRYLVVQLLAYILDMSTFFVFINYVLIDPIYANILSKSFAGIFAFIVQRKFTFRINQKKLARGQAIRYFFVLVVNIPIASFLLAMTLLFNLEAVFAKLLSDIACVGISYFLSKYFIFSSDKRSRGDTMPLINK
jgi:putative flippase GtrA